MPSSGSESVAVLGRQVQEAIHKYYDNSLGNIGNWNSFTW